MTPDEFNDVCASLGLTNSDIAMITGNTMRAIQFWRAGKNPVPQSVAILLYGMATGNIDMDFVAYQVAKLQQPVSQSA